MKDTAVYLGDSVYADYDGYMIKIYTNNGLGPENEIYLEPRTLEMLIHFSKRCIEREKETKEDV